MDDDGDDKDDTKRRSRNLSEKKRRDQFNMLVTELSNLITSNNRKMDKSTVLKSTISFLKNHNEVTVRSRAHDVQEDWKPAFLSNEEFTYLVLEALEGFVMVFSASGRIYYVSESITSLLGHKSVDVVNKSIFDLTFEEDRPNLYELLQRNAAATEQMPSSCKENEMIRFQIHLRRGTLDFREDVSYDLVQFFGHFRSNQEQDQERDMVCYQQDQESRVLFVCIGRLQTPQLIRDVSLVDSNRSEFTSRHSLEWKFLFLDHRAPPIIGYLPFEVLGTSGYDYYHFDDLDKVVTCHEALMRKGELTSCYYRFLTKGQQWIWLQTRFYITYHQWNSKPEFVVCTHRVVSYEDVEKTTKKENIEQDIDASETEANLNNNMKDAPSEEPLPPMSPSYMSEAASDAYGNSYRPISQSAMPGPPSSVLRVISLPNFVVPAISVTNCNMLPIPQPTLTPPPFGLPKKLTRPTSLTLNVARTRTPLNAQGFLLPSVTLPIISPSDISLATQSSTTESLPTVSPSFTAEATTDDLGNSSQLASQNSLNIPSPNGLFLSPTLSDRSDSFADSYQPISQASKRTPRSEDRRSVSPYFSPASVKSASAGSTAGTAITAATAGASWPRAHTRYTGGSDTASLSGESRSSQRNSERESHKPSETTLAPQHGMGTQYLNPPCYGGVMPAGMMPLSPMPVLVTHDHAQMQEQLQRKHEELQQMIVRQQEELRQVKEQLLLARLGLLQPLINVPNPYTTPEEMQNQQRMAQLAYTNAAPRAAIASYPHQVPLPSLPTHTTHPHPPLPPQPPHPPHPPHHPHPSEPHQHMPQ